MIGIITTGHGNFATGLTSSLNLIAGNVENYVAVDFVAEDSVEDLRAKLNAAMDSLKECEGILVFSDLAGGSPFKTAVEVMMTRDDKVEVLAGTNLAMLIEISMARTFIEGLEDLCNMAISTGKDQILKYAFVQRVEEIDEDGI